MSSNLTFLQEVRVASPCHALWRDMEGDEKSRFCSDCKLNVYNFSAMSADEAAELLLASEGRVCGRFYRRRDGTMITRDCPRGKRSVSTKKASFIVVGLGLLAAIGFAAVRPFQKDLEPDVSGYGLKDQWIDSARSAPIVGSLVDRLCPQQSVMGVIAVPSIRSGP